jgi:hypothetical protein
VPLRLILLGAGAHVIGAAADVFGRLLRLDHLLLVFVVGLSQIALAGLNSAGGGEHLVDLLLSAGDLGARLLQTADRRARALTGFVFGPTTAGERQGDCTNEHDAESVT